MTKPRRPSSSSGRTNLASCIVATIFLIFIAIVILIVFFTLFKPKDPTISVTAVRLPAFYLSDNNTAATFTFSQYAAVSNPNRDVFSHYDSSLQLLYSGNQVGFMFIPAGDIDSGRTKYMSATFSVQSFPLTAAPMDGVGEFKMVGPTLEIESKMRLAGRVRVLRFLTHHVESRAKCKVAIGVSDGSVLGFRC